MMLWLSVIVYLLLMCLSSDGQFCEISPSQIEPTYDVCKYNFYCRKSLQNTSFGQSECDCYSDIQLNLNYTILNSTLGKLEIMFTPFILCNFSVYEITLLVNERISEDTCHKVSYYDMTKHSSKKVSVKTSEPGGTSKEPCSENVTVVFNHVFTGCYMLKIQTEYKGNTKVDKLETYIATDYKKKNITDKLNYTTEYNKNSIDDVGVLHCNILHGVASEAQLFRFTLLKACSNNITAEMFVNTSGLTDQSAIKCVDKGLHNNNSCEYLNGMLSCVLHNVPSGNYCAKIEFIDDRCGIPSVWTDDKFDPCVWKLKNISIKEINMHNGPVLVPPESSSHMTFTVVLIVVSIVVLLGLLAFVAYRQVPAPYHVFIPTYNTKLKPLYVKERPTVLLLYARDCDEFMNVMAEFTYILKSSLKCQVFDCWDPIQYEKVAQSPTDWVLSLITDKNVRIILVATPCSCLLEKSLLIDKKVQYRQPDAFDKLFIFALRHLTETTILDSYNRIFVVRLDKNAQNNNSLTYLNPLTVHSLPTHLDKLMLGLHRVDPMEYTVSILDLPEVKHFSLSVESFQKFEQENPYYLNFLLE